jgi:hypothetical protein
MFGLPLGTRMRFVVWRVIGFVICGLYGTRESRVARAGARRARGAIAHRHFSSGHGRAP